MPCSGAVVEALVALLEHGTGSSAVGAPRGVVVDLRPRPCGPDENLQGVSAILSIVAVGHLPPFSVSRLFE
jgi:hypothetical protein